MAIVTVGIDLAKNVFALHGVNETGHRARQGYITARTAVINRIRGLLAEFGVVLPQKAEVVRREAANHLDDLPASARPSSRICSPRCATWTSASSSATCMCARWPATARPRSSSCS